jgi:AraC family transcriptional regulator
MLALDIPPALSHHCAGRVASPLAPLAFPPESSNDSPVSNEIAWRELDSIDAARLLADQIVITRWRYTPEATSRSHIACAGAHHVIAVYLKETRFTYTSEGESANAIRVPAGTVQVTLPGMAMGISFHDTADVLHLHVPQVQLDRCFESAYAYAFQGKLEIRRAALHHDAPIQALSSALAGAAQSCGAFAKIYTEGLVQAIVGRLLALQFSAPAIDEDAIARLSAQRLHRSARPLIGWRLRRTVDYIAANLDEALSLHDLAANAGLSPMYFAAQFRASTGMKPHEYVLRQRIEAAQSLLLQKGSRTIDVAMGTGFRSQAHFTMVFKRLTGTTPARWKTVTGVAAAQ